MMTHSLAPDNRTTQLALCGTLAGLAAMKAILLAALYSKTAPFPPAQFAPLIASGLAFSLFTICMVLGRSRWFLAGVIPVALESLLSFGPHKFFIGQSYAIYPAIVTGSTLIVILLVTSWQFRAELSRHG